MKLQALATILFVFLQGPNAEEQENLPNSAAKVARMVMTGTPDEHTKKTVGDSAVAVCPPLRLLPAMVVFKKVIQALKNMKKDFYILDKDQNGYLEKPEIQNFTEIFKRNSKVLSDEQLNALMACVDTNRDDKIDFNEFLKVFYP